MKPYYEDGSVTLYHGDCLDVLPGLARGADLLLTDPPYGISWENHRPSRQHFGSITGDDGSLDVGACLRAALVVVRPFRHLYVFGPADLSGLPVGEVVELIWDKERPGAGDWSAGWAPSHERVQFAVSVPNAYDRRVRRGNGTARLRRGSVLRYHHNSAGVRHHPSEKPVALLRELVEMSSRPGETVLDPFAGSGSAAVAAVMEGRRAVLIELEERYCEVAADRLRKMRPALALFEEAAG
jgi:site-specific DNA-methyltransferase (adenine-specific)